MEQHQHYQSLQDQAYNALRSKIIYAELKPGTRLSAIGLEKETGIGRTPIRKYFSSHVCDQALSFFCECFRKFHFRFLRTEIAYCKQLL